MKNVSEARFRAARSNIRNFLYPMTKYQMMVELDSAIFAGDPVRIRCINEYIQEVTEEEGVCAICGDWADGSGTDMCCDCMGE